MKICSACNEIVTADQGCARSDCPRQRSASAPDPAPIVEPGFTGRADRSVQAGLDRAGDAARDAARRAAFVVTTAFVVALFAMIFIFYVPSRSGSSETVTVTVAQEANVRNAASAEGSMVLETLTAGTQLDGVWVNGSTVPSERWLELEGGNRFIWSGNLKERLSSSPDASNEYQIDSSKIPSEYWGRWTADTSRCATRYDDSMVEIYGDSVRFWESEGEVTNVKWDGGKISVALSMFGEGERWESDVEIQKTSSQNQIRINDYLRFKCR
jgi:hypothetical protein